MGQEFVQLRQVFGLHRFILHRHDEQYFVSTGVWNIVMPDLYIEPVGQVDFLG
jgi:hypothetical protein